MEVVEPKKIITKCEEEEKKYLIDTSIFDRFEEIKNILNLVSHETICEKIQNHKESIDKIYNENLLKNILKVKEINQKETIYVLESDTFSVSDTFRNKKFAVSEMTLKNCLKNVNLNLIESLVYKSDFKGKLNYKYVLFDASIDILVIFYKILMTFQTQISYPTYLTSDVINIDNEYSEIYVPYFPTELIFEFNEKNPMRIQIPKYLDLLCIKKFLESMFLNFESDSTVIITYN